MESHWIQVISWLMLSRAAVKTLGTVVLLVFLFILADSFVRCLDRTFCRRCRVSFGEGGVRGAVCLALESDWSCVMGAIGGRAIAPCGHTLLLETLYNLADCLEG